MLSLPASITSNPQAVSRTALMMGNTHGAAHPGGRGGSHRKSFLRPLQDRDLSCPITGTPYIAPLYSSLRPGKSGTSRNVNFLFFFLLSNHKGGRGDVSSWLLMKTWGSPYRASLSPPTPARICGWAPPPSPLPHIPPTPCAPFPPRDHGA